jgi:DNA-binding MarR family transcriptional regulator
MATKKQHLLDATHEAARAQSTATVFFHHAIAQRFGLGVTDEKAMDVLARFGPLTAGEIAGHTGLAPASVTSLIDRLEQKGFVRRTRDAKDRRRVLVELQFDRLGGMTALFGALRERADRLFRRYSADELSVIHDYLVQSTEWLQAATEQIGKSRRSNQRQREAAEEEAG